MKRWTCGALLAAVVICTGTECVSTRLAWSPDGQYLAVAAQDKLVLADAQGKLLDHSLEGVKLVAWLPDSRRFVAVRDRPAPTWEAATEGLDAARQKTLIALADRLRAEVLAHQGDWDKFKPKTAEGLTGGELAALILYVRDHRQEGLADHLGEKRWSELQKLSVTLQVVQIFELISQKPEPRAVIGIRIDGIEDVRISPRGQTLAIVESGVEGSGRLLIHAMEDGDWRMVAESTSNWPDWSVDGKSLVYGNGGELHGDALRLGTLSRREVCDAQGRIRETFGDAQDLAGLIFFPQMKVRCLNDGRILFSAAEVTLPTAVKDMPQRALLFVVDPERQPGVTRVIPRDAEAGLPKGIELGFFELSPDQKRVAVMGSEAENGSIVVLELATGEVTPVVKAVKDLPPHVPAWRTPGELTFILPPDAPGGSQKDKAVMLWTSGDQARCLSCDWPVRLTPPPENGTTTPAP